MSVSIKREHLKDFVRSILFEQIGGRAVAAGDKTTMTGAEGSANPWADGETTVPSDVPVEPSEMMAAQVSWERPPVEDENFAPANSEELARSADVLSMLVPDSQVEKFYEDLKSLVQNHIEAERDAEVEKPPGMAEKMPLEQEEAREEVTGAGGEQNEGAPRGLREADWSQIKFGRQDDDDEQREPSDEELQAIDAGDPHAGEANLEDLAKVMGKSGPSGARQELERMMQRLQFIAQEVDDAALQQLQSHATSQYINALRDGEYIDDEDVEDLRLNRDMVRTQDSYRAFFVAGFVLPAFQKLKREARKTAEAQIEALGVPQRSKQTILNQALGETPTNAEKLARKIIKDATAEGTSEEESLKLVQKVQDAFDSIAKSAKIKGDLVAVARARWAGLSDAARQKVLQQSLEETIAFQQLEQELEEPA